MNEVPDPLVVRTEPDPTKPYKAYVSAAGGFLAAFLPLWIGDTGGVTAKEFGSWFLAGLLASGLVGGATYAKSNPLREVQVTRRRHFRR